MNDRTDPIVMPSVASKTRRLANYILDMIIFRLLLIPTWYLIGYFTASIGILNANTVVWLTKPIVEWLLGIVSFFFYYFAFETIWQRTPAKLITGTKVFHLHGTKPTAKTIAVRTLIRLVPFEPFSFLGKDAKGWHDIWSQTFVARLKKLETEMQNYNTSSVEQSSLAGGAFDSGALRQKTLIHERQATWFGISILIVALMAIPIVYFSNTPKDTQANIPSNQQYRELSTPSSQLVSHSEEIVLGPRDSRFALIRLPLGISIEVPENWFVIDGEINTTIETGGEAVYRLTGMDLPTSKKVNLFRANSSPPTTYASIAIYATNSDISPDELLEADETEIRELSPLMHQMFEQGLATQNCRIIQFDSIVREIVNGYPALVISYIRSGPNGPVVVQMTRLFVGDKEISLNLSYRLSEIQLWKPILDYMRTTFQIN